MKWFLYIIKGNGQATLTFTQSLQLFKLAESLGCIELVVEIPLLMNHMSIPEDIQKSVCITDNLVRLFVGINSTQ